MQYNNLLFAWYEEANKRARDIYDTEQASYDCGSDGAYARHLRMREDPDFACLSAHAAANKKRRSRQK